MTAPWLGQGAGLLVVVLLTTQATASQGAGTTARIYVTSLADVSDGTALPGHCRVFGEDGNDLSEFKRARRDPPDEKPTRSPPESSTPTVRLVASGSVVGGGNSLTTRTRGRMSKDRRRHADPAKGDVNSAHADGADVDRCVGTDGGGSCELARADPNTPLDCKCTLRAALLLANEVPLANSVVVELPRGVIHLSGQLPTITRVIKLSGIPPVNDVRATPEDPCIAASQSFACSDDRRGQPQAPQGATYPLCSVVDGQKLHRAIIFDPRDNPEAATPPLLGLQHLSFRNCRAFIGQRSPGDGSGNGGAIRVRGNAHLLAYNCEFANNHAERNGGAVQLTGEEGDAQFHLTSAYGNQARLCGGNPRPHRDLACSGRCLGIGPCGRVAGFLHSLGLSSGMLAHLHENTDHCPQGTLSGGTTDGALPPGGMDGLLAARSASTAIMGIAQPAQAGPGPAHGPVNLHGHISRYRTDSPDVLPDEGEEW
jgi:hypothetical protein